jgi:hypothetical protein
MLLNVPWWRRAWPASLFAAAVALVVAASAIVGALPGLRGTRAAMVVPVAGIWSLVVLGLPLLCAWALWSLMRVRHWAGKLAVYVAIVLSVCCFCVWFFFYVSPPRM